ncbi:MAG: class I SAM-dependent methyltransferase [Deltaproteobacteria bacterium]|nr:MAG: class I SAM-dependent methyltransferase [Deltaproteobacteria bacterium]
MEAAFHDAWAASIDPGTLAVRENFEAETACENRFALAELSPVAGKRLLDLGCGAGETSVYFALAGARVTAVDLSGEMLRVARRLAAAHGVSLETVQTPAETLPFPDESFDCVFGNGVLHHVALHPTLEEVHRVLVPGGKAVFIEPLPYNPIIRVYRWIARAVRTPTETPFSFRELPRIRKTFRRVEHREFWLTTLTLFLYFFFVRRYHPSRVRYWKRVIEEAEALAPLYRPLKRIDDRLLGAFPFLGRLCWNTVLVLTK